MPDELTVYDLHSERFMIVRGEDVVELQPRAADRFVDDLATESGGSSALSLFAAENARAGLLEDEQTQRDRLRDGLASGELVVVRLRGPARVLSEAPLEPLKPVKPLGPVDPPPLRPTWISLEVVHENGARYAGASLQIVTPDGRPRTLALDAASSWRADDVESMGHCKLAGSPALGDPAPATSLALTDDDAWLAPNASASVRLRTGHHHRVVVVSGSTNIELFDATSAPVASAKCKVSVNSSRIDGRTDANGRFVVHHPAGARISNVTFPAYDKSKIHPAEGNS